MQVFLAKEQFYKETVYMDQALRISISSDIFAIVIGLVVGAGIAIIYVRYLRRLRTPAHERTRVDIYGLLIIGVIAILAGLSGMTLLFYTYPRILTILVFILSLLVFTTGFVFTAKHSYKRNL